MEKGEENKAIEKKVLKSVGEEIAEKTASSLKESSDGTFKLIIQHNSPDQQLPIYAPVNVDRKGILDSVYRFLQQRIDLIDLRNSTVTVDREKMSISLQVDEKNHFTDSIAGRLESHPDFDKFNINTGATLTPMQLGNFLKMNRHVFLNKAENMALVGLLKGFVAKVGKDIEEKKANNGNQTNLKELVVESNLPPSFKIVLPLFKGEEPKEIEVEIDVDATGHQIVCSLVSPDAQFFIETTKNSAIDDQIKLIKELAPTLLILEK